MFRLRVADPPTEQRFGTFGFSQYLELLDFAGYQYMLPSAARNLHTSRLEPPQLFEQYVQVAYRGNGVIGAAVAARAYLMSQLRLKWRREDGSLFTTPDLDAFNRPARVRRSLLFNQMERHVSLMGAAYPLRQDRVEDVTLLRPDWCTLILGSELDADAALHQHDAALQAVVYRPGGSATATPVMFGPDEVAQWVPEPDPTCWWTGSAWVQSLISEVLTDRQAGDFTAKFFENGATPQVIVSLDPSVTAETATQYADMFRDKYEGASKAFKTMILGGGADPTVVGVDLRGIQLRELYGHLETRIAIRSRVPAAILGIQEGLGGSALNAGNYGQLRRMWSDSWFAPHAQDFCGAVAPLVDSPGPDVELSFDPKLIEFVQEDRKDEAEIRQSDAITARQLVEAGYEPDSVADYIDRGDIKVLKHTGNLSVQLQPPGSQASEPVATSN